MSFPWVPVALAAGMGALAWIEWPTIEDEKERLLAERRARLSPPMSPMPSAPVATVADAQSALNTLGYGPLAVTGVVDAATARATTQFQTDARIPVDGQPGETTFAALSRVLAQAPGPAPSPRTPASAPAPASAPPGATIARRPTMRSTGQRPHPAPPILRGSTRPMPDRTIMFDDFEPTQGVQSIRSQSATGVPFQILYPVIHDRTAAQKNPAAAAAPVQAGGTTPVALRRTHKGSLGFVAASAAAPASDGVALQMPPAIVTPTGSASLHVEDLTDVQGALNVLGYGPLKVDGVMGPFTQSATLAFQVAQGNLKADGDPGPETKAALASALASLASSRRAIGQAPSVQSASRQSAQATVPLLTADDIQVALNMLGASPLLRRSGQYDPPTVAAIKAFQLLHGLRATGVADSRTVTALSLAMAPLGPANVAGEFGWEGRGVLDWRKASHQHRWGWRRRAGMMGQVPPPPPPDFIPPPAPPQFSGEGSEFGGFNLGHFFGHLLNPIAPFEDLVHGIKQMIDPNHPPLDWMPSDSWLRNHRNWRAPQDWLAHHPGWRHPYAQAGQQGGRYGHRPRPPQFQGESEFGFGRGAGRPAPPRPAPPLLVRGFGPHGRHHRRGWLGAYMQQEEQAAVDQALMQDGGSDDDSDFNGDFGCAPERYDGGVMHWTTSRFGQDDGSEAVPGPITGTGSSDDPLTVPVAIAATGHHHRSQDAGVDPNAAAAAATDADPNAQAQAASDSDANAQAQDAAPPAPSAPPDGSGEADAPAELLMDTALPPPPPPVLSGWQPWRHVIPPIFRPRWGLPEPRRAGLAWRREALWGRRAPEILHPSVVPHPLLHSAIGAGPIARVDRFGRPALLGGHPAEVHTAARGAFARPGAGPAPAHVSAPAHPAAPHSAPAHPAFHGSEFGRGRAGRGGHGGSHGRAGHASMGRPAAPQMAPQNPMMSPAVRQAQASGMTGSATSGGYASGSQTGPGGYAMTQQGGMNAAVPMGGMGSRIGTVGISSATPIGSGFLP